MGNMGFPMPECSKFLLSSDEDTIRLAFTCETTTQIQKVFGSGIYQVADI